MKITIKDLLQKSTEAAKEKDRLEHEQKEALRRSADLKEKAEAAAAAGNDDEYIRLIGESDRQKAVAHVREMRAKKLSNPVSKEECVDAWKSFCGDYEKALNTKLAVVDKARAAYIAAYNEAVKLQEQACETRERLGAFIGLKPDLLGQFDSIFPLVGIPTVKGGSGVFLSGPLGMQDRELAFVTSYMGENPTEVARNSDARRMISIVVQKRTK